MSSWSGRDQRFWADTLAINSTEIIEQLPQPINFQDIVLRSIRYESYYTPPATRFVYPIIMPNVVILYFFSSSRCGWSQRNGSMVTALVVRLLLEHTAWWRAVQSSLEFATVSDGQQAAHVHYEGGLCLHGRVGSVPLVAFRGSGRARRRRREWWPNCYATPQATSRCAHDVSLTRCEFEHYWECFADSILVHLSPDHETSRIRRLVVMYTTMACSDR